MRNKIKLLVWIFICSSLIIGCSNKEIRVSDVLDLVQSNYLSVEIKDKKIEAGSNQQYLIDDFILKLQKYTLTLYTGEIPNDFSNKVIITYKDGSVITLLDNDYIEIDDKKYEIVDGSIDLEKFYQFIE